MIKAPPHARQATQKKKTAGVHNLDTGQSDLQFTGAQTFAATAGCC